MIQPDLSHIKGVIWDLDGTLYRYDELFKQACNIAAARTALSLGLNMSLEDAIALATRSESQHGSSMKLFAEHGLKYEDFHEPYHRAVDETIIAKNREMLDALNAVNMPMVILTNASRPWAQRTLAHLEMDRIFADEKLIALEDVGFQSKASSQAGFLRALDIMGLPAQSVLMVEDMAQNLVIAKYMGMTTALVHHGHVSDDAPSAVDHYFQDTIALMKALAA